MRSRCVLLIGGVVLLAPALLAGCFGGGGGGETPGYGRITGHVRMLNTPVPTVPSAAPRVRSAAAFALPAEGERERPEAIPGELAVMFRPGVSKAQIESVMRRHGLGVKEVLKLSRVHVIETRGRPVEDVLRALEGEDIVEWASPRYVARPLETPDDTYYPYQWHYPAISLPAAWDYTVGDGSIVVAVIDTGADLDHPDLAGRLVDWYDVFHDSDAVEDYHGHGTHVAGTIGAVTDNGLGVAGVNWDVRIMPLKVSNDDVYLPVMPFEKIAEAIYRAVDRGARVINMSIGGQVEGNAAVDSAIAYATSAGVIMVAAAGNDGPGSDLRGTINYPASNPNVIAVGAVRPDLARPDWSSCGPELDLMAPGGPDDGGPAQDHVLSTWKGGSYQYARGTSMASPHVAGVVALMLARGIPPSEVRSILQLTAMDLGPLGRDDGYGYGLVNAHAAVTRSCITSMQVFAGDEDEADGLIHVKSAVAAPSADGFYAIADVEPGSWRVYGWIDSNQSGAVDARDYFGRTTGRITAGGKTTTGVNFDVSLVGAGAAGRAIVPWTGTD